MEPDEPSAAPRPPDIAGPRDAPITPSGGEQPPATPSGEVPSPQGAASPSGFPPAPLGPPTGAPPPGPGVGAPPPVPPPGASPPAPPGARPPGNVNRILFIGLSVLIVVLLAVGAFVLLGDDDTTASTSSTSEPDDTTTTTEAEATTTTTTESTTTTTTAAESTPPASTYVSSGGLTFTRLPEPWLDWATGGRGQIAEIPGAAGQYVVVQEVTPTGGQWVGNLLIGDLNASFDYGGEDDLPATTQAVSDQLIANHYVAGADSSVVREQPVTIDGRPAYFMHHELTFLTEGVETTREKVVVVVVDTGRARPGVFWASIPYNRIDLNEGMDAVYRTLQVND